MEFHQTTLLSFFQYRGTQPRWEAFTRMGRSPLQNQNIPGLTFWKPLGTGAGNGFSIKPDFSTYALLTVFEKDTLASAFVQSEMMQAYLEAAEGYTHIYMNTAQVHGCWSGQTPFKREVPLDKTKAVAVITRATIKPHYAPRFWWNVPSVAKSMEGNPALIYSKGIGEWPIFMQATFSLWTSLEAMQDYAYKNPKHHAMVKKTRELGWYSEELFARFHISKIEGSLIPDIERCVL